MLRPLELERDAVGEGAQAVEPVEILETFAEAHVVELAHRAGREPVAARLFSWKGLLLHDEDVVTGRREPVRSRRPRGTAAYHEHLVAGGRRRHQPPLAVSVPASAAPSVVQPGGTGFSPDSTTRS